MLRTSNLNQLTLNFEFTSIIIDILYVIQVHCDSMSLVIIINFRVEMTQVATLKGSYLKINQCFFNLASSLIFQDENVLSCPEVKKIILKFQDKISIG